MYNHDITDNDLRAFCHWYADFHGDTDITPGVLLTCMCGYFHTYTKAADQLLNRCMRLKAVTADHGDTVKIVINNENTTYHEF